MMFRKILHNIQRRTKKALLIAKMFAKFYSRWYIHHLAVLVLDSLVDIDGEGVVVGGHDVDHLLAVQAGRHGDMVPHAGVGLLGPDQGGHAVAGNIALYVHSYGLILTFTLLRALTTKIT